MYFDRGEKERISFECLTLNRHPNGGSEQVVGYFSLAQQRDWSWIRKS